MTAQIKNKSNSKNKKFNLVKAVKKAARDNTIGMNLSGREHADKTVYERASNKKKLVKEVEEIDVDKE